jgi:hypothetical protein
MAQINPQSATSAQPQIAPDTLTADAPQTLTGNDSTQPETLTADVPKDSGEGNGSTDESEQPGFVSRAMEQSGAAGIGTLIGKTGGYVGTMPGRTFNRVKGIQAAYEALKQGDLKKASMIAHTLATGPDDPVTEMAKQIIKMPFDEAAEAYKAFRDAPDKVVGALTAAQHGIRSIPVIGDAAEHVGNTIAEDLHNNNWSGLSGDLVGIVPALLMGGEGRAAEAAEASTAEGAADAAREAKSSAIRPSQRMIGRTPVPVTALQDEAPSLRAQGLEKLANNPAAKQAAFAAERTQPAAVNATVNNLEDVARNHIQALRDQFGNHTPFESDMSTLRKQSGAMKDAAQEVYKRFDAASDADQEAYKTSTKLAEEAHNAAQEEKETAFNEAQDANKTAFDKAEQEKVKASAGKATPYKAKPFKAEKFEGEDFEPEERPMTFRELQTQRGEALQAMKAGASPEAYQAAKNQLKATEQQMDDFAAKHQDVVSPEEYNLANATRKAAGQHDFITDKLNIDTGTDEIPASITRGSLKSLPRAFDKRYGEGAFEKYLGPEGANNYNAVRDVLENPEQRNGLMDIAKTITRHSVGAGVGAVAGGLPGAVAGEMLQYSIGKIAENLLFNPEYGQTVMAAYRASQRLRPAATAGIRTAAVTPKSKEATHVWSPETGVQPIQ